MRTCRTAFEGGYSTVKLYFMLGLPEETLEDVEGIAKLAKRCLTFITKRQKKSVARAYRFQFLLQHSYQSLLLRLSSSHRQLPRR